MPLDTKLLPGKEQAIADNIPDVSFQTSRARCVLVQQYPDRLLLLSEWGGNRWGPVKLSCPFPSCLLQLGNCDNKISPEFK